MNFLTSCFQWLGSVVPKIALALVLEWASMHREELMEDWKLCEKKQLPTKIAPLE
jgi:hypothetical protein